MAKSNRGSILFVKSREGTQSDELQDMEQMIDHLFEFNRAIKKVKNLLLT